MSKRAQYRKAWLNKLKTAENKVLPKISNFYKSEYRKGIKNFIETGATNYQTLFQYGYVKKFYETMYADIGIDFAVWWSNSYLKYIKKADPIGSNKDIWVGIFTAYGNRVAATNVSLVSGTAKKTLESVIRNLFKDPDLALLGADEKARILTSKFDQYSFNQARRLVRTESNRIANYATQEAALTIFGKDNLQKTWIHSLGPNERPSHVALNDKTIPYDEPFMVGVEPMMRPGAGSAENVINCRCTINYEPIEVPGFGN
jgi:hypothetical protein